MKMPRKFPVIHEKAVIAHSLQGSPVGEAPKAGDPQPLSLMPPQERQEMAERLEKSIFTLMDEAKNAHEANNLKYNDPDHITRMSTNEFFFYTKEPLTLKEFEELQNKIAEKAKTMPEGVQLILGSFGVKTDDGKVMNVVPHISCGNPPDFHLIVKSNTSAVDVRYKEPDGIGGMDTLPMLDSRTHKSSMPMPQITIDGKVKDFSFNNIVPCKTPGGTQFLTAIDICLDHSYGVAKKNYLELAKKNPEILELPISHVVVSNWIRVDKTKCLGSAVMHVDPVCSPQACKQDITQQKGSSRKLAFGNDSVTIFDVVGEKVHLLVEYVKNTYAYKTTDPSAGRDHKSYTVTLDKVEFQKSQTSADFTTFKNKYQAHKGDHLKTLILEDLQKRIEGTTTKQELADLKEELMHSYEGDVLKKSQGWFTEKFGLKTSSQKVLENMLEQQEKYLSDTSPKLST